MRPEIGHAGPRLAGWSDLIDVSEDVPELAWPTCLPLWDKMANDEQIASLMLALLLPIYRYRWYLDPNGARDEVVEFIANDLAVDVDGRDPYGRRRGDAPTSLRPSCVQADHQPSNGTQSSLAVVATL